MQDQITQSETLIGRGQPILASWLNVGRRNSNRRRSTPDGPRQVVGRPTSQNAAFLVKIKRDGGSAGGVGSTCSFTYSLFSLSGEQALTSPDGSLATLVSPEQSRTAGAEYAGPSMTDFSLGLAATDENRQPILLHAYEEVIIGSECPDP